MNKYALRKNIIATYSKDITVRGRLVFKTKDTHWLETQDPCIALVSIDSAFNESVAGELKMNAFISTIKNHVRSKITVLLADRAHLQTASLHYQEDLEKAFAACLKATHILKQRYQCYFEECDVAYWHSYIYQDEYFAVSLNLIKDLYEKDPLFQSILLKDAEASYTPERMQQFPNKCLFIEKTVADLLEQCACILVLSKKGYRFQFYPGKSHDSTEYVNNLFLVDKKISWITVNLSVEKKTIIPSKDMLIMA